MGLFWATHSKGQLERHLWPFSSKCAMSTQTHWPLVKKMPVFFLWRKQGHLHFRATFKGRTAKWVGRECGGRSGADFKWKRFGKDTETNLELQIAICDVFFQMDSIWVIIRNQCILSHLPMFWIYNPNSNSRRGKDFPQSSLGLWLGLKMKPTKINRRRAYKFAL